MEEKHFQIKIIDRVFYDFQNVLFFDNFSFGKSRTNSGNMKRLLKATAIECNKYNTCIIRLVIRKKWPYSELFWSVFWVSLRIQSEWGRMRRRITPNTDTFCTVQLFVKKDSILLGKARTHLGTCRMSKINKQNHLYTKRPFCHAFFLILWFFIVFVGSVMFAAQIQLICMQLIMAYERIILTLFMSMLNTKMNNVYWYYLPTLRFYILF